MPTVQAHFTDEAYLHLINNFDKGDRSEAVREAYKQVHMDGEAE